MTHNPGPFPAARDYTDTDAAGWPRDGWIVAALLLLPLLVLLPAALLRGVFYLHDLQHYFYPYHAMPAALLHRGELPLWNPFAFSGMPLIGDGQTALFYPPNWLFFLLPGGAALNYDVLSQFSIAGAGMYLFGRNLGAGRLPAIIGAVTFMFCGFLTARVVHLSIQSGAALIPLVFLCVDRAFAASHDQDGRCRSFVLRRRRWLAAAAGAVGLQAVSGHPQVPIYTALALGLYALFHAIVRWRAQHDARWLYRCPLRLTAIYVLGYSLAAVQLVPWVELGTFSPRAANASFEFVLGNSMTGGDWLLMLFPYLNGSLGPTIYSAQPLPLMLMVRTWEHSAYAGILPLGLAAFALAGAFKRHSLHTRFYGLLLLAAALFAAGKYTPVGTIIYHLPVVGRLRDVERAMALVDFALAALAVLGAQRLLALRAAPAGEEPRERPTGRAGWNRELLVLAAATVLLPLLIVGAGQAWVVQHALRLAPQAAANLSVTQPNVAVPLLFTLLSGALLAWWSRRGPTTATLRLAAALVLLDLGCYAALFNPLAEPRLYERRPEVLTSFAGSDEPLRKATFIAGNELDKRPAQELLAVSWSMVYGVEDINGFNSLQSRRYTDYLFGPRISDVSYGLLDNPRLLRAENPVLSSLNVRYVLVPPQAAAPADPVFRKVYENPRVRVYENLSAYPRAFFPDATQVATDPSAILQTVTADGFDGRRLALLETDAPPDLAPAVGAASVAFTRRSANRISLTTDTASPRLLVLSEMYYPGWQATVDGAATPIYRANYLFRSIVVPAGRHSVEFSYRPLSVLIGAAISLVALALCGVFVWQRRDD